MKRLLAFATVMLAGCTPGSPIGESSNGNGLIGRVKVAPVNLVAQQSRSLRGDLLADALDYVRAQKPALSLSDNDDFVAMRSHLGLDGLSHARLQQLHSGVRVWGADLVVHGS